MLVMLLSSCVKISLGIYCDHRFSVLSNCQCRSKLGYDVGQMFIKYYLVVIDVTLSVWCT